MTIKLTRFNRFCEVYRTDANLVTSNKHRLDTIKWAIRTDPFEA